jgi:hypothetical protein
MNDITNDAQITIDGVDYAIEDLSEKAKSQISNIQFSDAQILQLQNELAISNTARTGYTRALKLELAQIEQTGS